MLKISGVKAVSEQVKKEETPLLEEEPTIKSKTKAIEPKEMTFKAYTCHICDQEKLLGLFSLACHLWHHHYDEKDRYGRNMCRKIERYTENALRAIHMAQNAIGQTDTEHTMHTCEYCGKEHIDTAVHFVAHIMKNHMENGSILHLEPGTRRAFKDDWQKALPAFNHFYMRTK